MIPPLTEQITVTSRVELVDGVPELADANETRQANITYRREPTAGDGTRGTEPHARVYLSGPLEAGARYTDRTPIEWQVVTASRPLQAAWGTVGHLAEALPLTGLYPVEGSIRTPADVHIADCRLAVWDDEPDQAGQGRIDRWQAEIPLEHADLAVQNNQIRIGGVTRRIVNPRVDPSLPAVRCELRRGKQSG